MQKDYVENFAYKVFEVADNQDRAGHPTKYANSIELIYYYVSFLFIITLFSSFSIKIYCL